MITLQLLQTIILACQVVGTTGAGGHFYAKSYLSVHEAQTSCQKQLIKCVQEKYKKQQVGDYLTECLLER